MTVHHVALEVFLIELGFKSSLVAGSITPILANIRINSILLGCYYLHY
jgi:hypothetical protein